MKRLALLKMIVAALIAVSSLISLTGCIAVHDDHHDDRDHPDDHHDDQHDDHGDPGNH